MWGFQSLEGQGLVIRCGAGRRAFASFRSSKRPLALLSRLQREEPTTMNETVLALLSALAIYGLSSLALTRPDMDPRDDATDIQTDETVGVSGRSAAEDDRSSRQGPDRPSRRGAPQRPRVASHASDPHLVLILVRDRPAGACFERGAQLQLRISDLLHVNHRRRLARGARADHAERQDGKRAERQRRHRRQRSTSRSAGLRCRSADLRSGRPRQRGRRPASRR